MSPKKKSVTFKREHSVKQEEESKFKKVLTLQKVENVGLSKFSSVFTEKNDQIFEIIIEESPFRKGRVPSEYKLNNQVKQTEKLS